MLFLSHYFRSCFTGRENGVSERQKQKQKSKGDCGSKRPKQKTTIERRSKRWIKKAEAGHGSKVIDCAIVDC